MEVLRKEMKKTFELDVFNNGGSGTIKIIGTKPKYKPYVKIDIGNVSACVKDTDLRKLAIGILHSLNTHPSN